MKATVAAVALHALAAQGARIVQANDDGWAELYLRSFNDALNAAGHDVVLSGPAENKSGSGSSDEDPTTNTDPCEYNSCPANSGPTGFNSSRPDLNWVNSYPATAMRFGLDTFGPKLWNGAKAELAVTGPNVGTNLFLQVPFSGTVGAAVYAAHTEGVPAIAFSGGSSGNLAWDTEPVPARSLIYAELATNLTNVILDSGAPYLPNDTFLNVNFPEVKGSCTDASAFKWVLSRINPGTFSAPDVNWCGSTRLPTETSVYDTDGCYASISMGDASDKTDINDNRQDAILAKLKDILVCLPS